MAMSFVPQMQNYFGKDTDFTKLSSAYGDSNALGVQTDIQGDLIREQAKNRAEMRLMAGKHSLSQGQQAGSHAVLGGAISGIGSALGGGIQGGHFGGKSYGGTGSTGGLGDTVRHGDTGKYGSFVSPFQDPTMQSRYPGIFGGG